MSTTRWSHAGRIVVVLLLALTLWSAPTAAGSSPTRADRLIGSYLNHNHVATANIQAGRNPSNPQNSSARHYYNERITRVNSTNTLQSRTIARGAYLHSLAMQEVCEGNFNAIIWELTSKGHMSGSGGYRARFKVGLWDSPSGTLHQDCGVWFGLATLTKGAVAGEGAGVFTNQDGEPRVWMCVQTYLVQCNTHVSFGSARGAQLNEFRAISNYTAANAPGLSSYGSGDFNTNPGDWNGVWAAAWAFDGWRDADNMYYQATYDYGGTLDYIWRRDPASWAYDAYVSAWSYTDHHWKQGYF